MKNPFKRKTITTHVDVFTGKVKFILKGELKEGTIFGKPYNSDGLLFSVGGITYHVVDENGKVHEVKAHSIERLK